MDGRRAYTAQVFWGASPFLHIDYDEIVQAFAEYGIDIHADEGTPDHYLQEQVDKFDALTPQDILDLGATLRACAPDEYRRFMEELEASVIRKIERIVILPLAGRPFEFTTLDQAVDALCGGDMPIHEQEFVRFEIMIRFNNGDSIDAKFGAAGDAIEFLETFR